MSPTSSTDGMYPKKWIIIDGFRTLLKVRNFDRHFYDDISGVFASQILRVLTSKNRVKYADYFTVENGYCGSFNFVKEGQNLVSAYRYLLHIGEDPGYTTKDQRYHSLIQPFGHTWLDVMMILDYVVFNIDRHLNNFGFIQNSDTGELLCPAPIFDTGSSIFAAFGVGAKDDICNKDFKARTFASTHNLQIKLVKLSAYQDELMELRTNIKSLFYETYKSAELKDLVLSSMAQLLQERIEFLCKDLHKSKHSMFT